ncbi:MAG TPA: LysR substrate-binding domain-containing protein [Paralcaligenes sp.]|jgi:LysR family glycine cleavage system transcriptional activator
MKRNLPPLSALRAFEAAARHLSFTKAGIELNVTQGAISRQIKILESYLKTSLFNRLTRQVELTPFGQCYLTAISLALDAVEQATHDSTSTHHSLSISVLPSIGSLWLMQRLTVFACAYPEIRLHISSSLDPADFKHDRIDLAIRHGKLPGQVYCDSSPQIEFHMTEDWTGITAIHLWDDYVTPVCSKKLLEKYGPLECPQDLSRFCLIYNDRRADVWQSWLNANGAETITGAGKLEFTHSFLVANAARQGLGVACLSTVEVEPVDWRDEIVLPFKSRVKSAGGYYLIAPQEKLQSPDAKLFLNWLAALL